MKTTWILLFAVISLCTMGCDDGSTDGDGDGDGDSDGDGDGDGDGDSDGDGDGDGDGDSDGVTLSVDGWERRIHVGSSASSTGNVFIRIDLTLANAAGSDPAPLAYNSFTLTSESAASISPWPGSSTLEMWCELGAEVAGGAQDSCEIVFEIANTDTPERLHWSADDGRTASAPFGDETPVPICEELRLSESGDCFTCLAGACTSEAAALQAFSCGAVCSNCATTAGDVCDCVENNCGGDCEAAATDYFVCMVATCGHYC